MKLALISDTHLGNRQYGLREREEDFFRAFEWCLKEAAGHGCSVVLHCGDLFDVQRPKNRVIHRAYRIVEEAGVMLIVIPGNHDYAWRADDPPGILLGMDGHNTDSPVAALCIHQPVENVIVGEWNIVGIRFLTASEMKKWNEIKAMAESMVRSGYVNVLLMHQEWREVSPYPETCAVASSDLPNGFDYVLFGHIHVPPLMQRHRDTVIINAGSTENCSVAEAIYDKYMWLLDGNKLQKLKIPTRSVVVVETESDFAKLHTEKSPMVILKNPELEADVLAAEPLHVIREYSRKQQTRRTDRRREVASILFQNDVPEEIQDIYTYLVDVALNRTDLKASELAEVIGEKLEEVLNAAADVEA